MTKPTPTRAQHFGNSNSIGRLIAREMRAPNKKPTLEDVLVSNKRLTELEERVSKLEKFKNG
jgi:hypothetical protein